MSVRLYSVILIRVEEMDRLYITKDAHTRDYIMTTASPFKRLFCEPRL
jgi:hypothetical protein